jgi:hypothetical protein
MSLRDTGKWLDPSKGGATGQITPDDVKSAFAQTYADLGVHPSQLATAATGGVLVYDDASAVAEIAPDGVVNLNGPVSVKPLAELLDDADVVYVPRGVHPGSVPFVGQNGRDHAAVRPRADWTQG